MDLSRNATVHECHSQSRTGGASRCYAAMIAHKMAFTSSEHYHLHPCASTNADGIVLTSELLEYFVQ